METTLVLFLFAALVIGIGGAVLSYRRERARVAQFTHDAAQRGWAYVEEDWSYAQFGTVVPFGIGHSRTARHVMSGECADREFVAFEYIYKITTADSRGRRHTRTYRHAVVSVGVGGALPVIRIYPENIGTRLATALGGTDVQVESAQFNRLWKVWSRDERTAHAVLTPRMIERLLEQDAQSRAYAWEPGVLYAAVPGAMTLAFVDSLVPILGQLADLVPNFLAEDHPAS